jgi:histone H3
MAKTSKTYDGTHGVAAALGPSAPRRTGDETRTGKVFPRGEGGKEPRNRQQRRGGKEPRRQPATGANPPVPTVIRPPRRRRPGEAALAEIRLMQKSVGLIISKAAMSRLVREVAQSIPGHKTDLRWSRHALEAIHEAVEAYAVRLFERSNLCAIHGNRVTIKPKDMDLVLKISEE